MYKFKIGSFITRADSEELSEKEIQRIKCASRRILGDAHDRFLLWLLENGYRYDWDNNKIVHRKGRS